MTDYREILRLSNIGLNQTSIRTALGYSRNTISDVLRRAQMKGIKHPLPDSMGEKELQALLYPEKAITKVHKMPEYEKIHKELAKKGVTLTLLWEEYNEECRANGEIPYAFTQFRVHYHQYATTTKATLHINHKPGEVLEVDWAGTTMSLTDNITGEPIPVYVFVAVLPYSCYAYAEGFLSRNEENWVNAHIHALEYFGGSTRILRPDNLKTGVEEADYYAPVINKSYQELAEYYGCAVIPARVKKPQDKATVENSVGIVTTWIIASLRNRKFFSVTELNEAVAVKLLEYNEKPFQKTPGNRLSIFSEEEKEYLQPLPTERYELAVWKKVICGYNYHILIDTNYYSVPYEFIKYELDVRLTSTTVEVFFNNLRIGSHPRIHGKIGVYSTIPEHMPEKHRKYTQWDSESFISWAETIGEHAKITVKSILSSHKVEQQGYRACLGIMKLCDKHGIERLERACEKALSYTPSPSYKNIESILNSGSDKLEKPKKETKPAVDESHSFIRGAEYYGRKR